MEGYTKDEEIHHLKSIIEALEEKLALFNVSSSEAVLMDFAKDMQNICVMDDKLTYDEYVKMWIESINN